MALSNAPAWADGGNGRPPTSGVGAGGLGGVDGSLAEATGKNATGSNTNVGGGDGKVTGGAGGTGIGSGGGGGAAAILLTDSATIQNSGTLTGGAGGRGAASGGGAGGAGVQILNGGTIINQVGGTIVGVVGGQGTQNSTVNPPIAPGDGGAGIKGSGIKVTNAGAITGGAGGTGGGAAGNAIEFTGGTNSLEIWNTSVINGTVAANGTDDKFLLGGAGNGTFDVSRLGAGQQYQGSSIMRNPAGAPGLCPDPQTSTRRGR